MHHNDIMSGSNDHMLGAAKVAALRVLKSSAFPAHVLYFIGTCRFDAGVQVQMRIRSEIQPCIDYN
jgi:hypothetical protein